MVWNHIIWFAAIYMVANQIYGKIFTLICETPFSALVCPGSRVRLSGTWGKSLQYELTEHGGNR